MICFIHNNINKMDLDTKTHVCKILLAFEVNVKQNNNGAYCSYDDIDDVTIENVFDYLANLFNK